MNVAGSMSKRVPGLLALVFSFAACAQQTVEVVIQDYKFLLAEVADQGWRYGEMGQSTKGAPVIRSVSR
jgi:hypothetical protein